MKRKYITPVTEHFATEPATFICGSKTKLAIRPHAEWGDESKYAPSEWVNEKHKPNIPWPGVGVDDDPDDLPSRSKGHSLWDDDDDY